MSSLSTGKLSSDEMGILRCRIRGELRPQKVLVYFN